MPEQQIIAGLLALTLEMGRVIRQLDENGEHSELWTQDGEYVADPRYRAAVSEAEVRNAIGKVIARVVHRTAGVASPAESEPGSRHWPDGKRMVARPCGLCMGFGCRMCKGTGRYEPHGAGGRSGETPPPSAASASSSETGQQENGNG